MLINNNHFGERKYEKEIKNGANAQWPRTMTIGGYFVINHLSSHYSLVTLASAMANENIENWVNTMKMYEKKKQSSVTNVFREKFTELITDSCLRLFSRRALLRLYHYLCVLLSLFILSSRRFIQYWTIHYSGMCCEFLTCGYVSLSLGYIPNPSIYFFTSSQFTTHL